MTGQFPDQRQVLAAHDSLACCRVSQVVELQPAKLRISAQPASGQ